MHWHLDDIAPDPFFWLGLPGQLLWMWCCLGVCIGLLWYRTHLLACGLLASLVIASGAVAVWIDSLMWKLDTPGVALWRWHERPVLQAYLWHWGRLAVICGVVVAILAMFLFVLAPIRRARLGWVGFGFGLMFGQFVAYFYQQLQIVHHIDIRYTLPSLVHKGVFYAGLVCLAVGAYRAIRASEAKGPILRLWRAVVRMLFAMQVRT